MLRTRSTRKTPERQKSSFSGLGIGGRGGWSEPEAISIRLRRWVLRIQPKARQLWVRLIESVKDPPRPRRPGLPSRRALPSLRGACAARRLPAATPPGGIRAALVARGSAELIEHPLQDCSVSW